MPARSCGLLLLFAFFLTGCISEQGVWADYLTKSLTGETLTGHLRLADGAAPSLRIDEAALIPARPFEAFAEGGTVSVICNAASPLRAAATELAAALGTGWERMRTSLGYDPGLRPRFVVVPVAKLPEELRLALHIRNDRMRFPILWREGADLPSVLADNQLALAICVHELVEIALLRPQRSPTALPDLGWSWGPFGQRFEAHTRWFRDGLANYAAYRFLDGIEEVVAARHPERALPRWSRSPLASFDRLAHVGPSLFDWSQFDDEGHLDLYPAACGLFLLFEEQHGTDALHDLLARVDTLEFPHGTAIEHLFEPFLGRPLRQWAADFVSPTGVCRLDSAGLGQEIRVAPGGPAAGAGLRTGDRLLAVDGEPHPDLITLELAVLRAWSDQRTIEVEVLRADRRLLLRWRVGSN